VKAVWNILNQSGLRPHVISWFASQPAEPIQGVYVSNAFHQAVGPAGKPWPVPPRSVHPERLGDTLAALRLHPGELTGDDLLPFVPELARVDQTKDKRLTALAVTLAGCATTHAVATWVLENELWDFLAVYYDAIDHTCHHFMDYYPPKADHVPEEDFELYQGVVTGMYRFHDMMLGRIVELAGPEATIMIVSDHGFHSDQLRPRGSAELRPETPLHWHRPYGIFCLAGPGVRRDELVFGASLLDIAPTVLALFGLPAGADMPGRPLVEAFAEPIPVERIPSWELVPGPSGTHPPEAAPGPEEVWESEAAIRQLADLGYVDAPSKDQERQVKLARLHQTFNLARLHLAAGRAAEASPLLEALVQETPESATFKLYLAQSYFQSGRLDASRQVVKGLIQPGDERPMARFLLGNLCLAEGKMEEGLAHLLAFEGAPTAMPRLRCTVGRVYARLGRWDDAERSFRDALSLDPDLPAAHVGMARVFLERKLLREAAESALTAIGLEYNSPAAHYFLGMALAGLGRIPRAIQAFEACLALRPGLVAAHQWLAAIHEQATGDRERAQAHRRKAQQSTAGQLR
jgi:tetratricopeptide (TPR) repeat protein